MALSAGTRLGPYEILAPLGAGGMGEVYRARDTRLDRTVAIKVLPGHLSAKPDLRRRLEREAKAVSQLSHPHICTLHDVGREGETDFLVMEYLEGETLAHRLEKGRLPLDQALRTATEIADALDKAHRRGVVHRDLKPGNVMLTMSGAKLLDFGLAKLREPGGVEEVGLDSALPTKARPLTEEGKIVGTYPYMAPEQLEGQEADARTDIFAFGAVLYEMVTGKRAFEGKSRASLIAAILSSEPQPISELRPMSPPLLDRVVRRCLGKDPDGRWQSAADLADELRWISEGGPGQVAPAPRPRLRSSLAWSVAALAIVVAGAALWRSAGPSARPVTRPFNRLVVNLPASGLARGVGNQFALSTDGRTLAYTLKGPDGIPELYVRGPDDFEARRVVGTRGAVTPFFSPDGEWVGFFAKGKLQKVPVLGGAPFTICEWASLFVPGASWGADDTILFAGERAGLWRVPAAGGSPEQVTSPSTDEGERGHAWPHILPGDRRAVFTITTEDVPRIALLSLASGTWRTLIGQGGVGPQYLPTGHLLFVQRDSLMACRFDLARLEPVSTAVPVVNGLMTDVAITGERPFAVSETGVLAYLATGDGVVGGALVWVDRQGNATAFPERHTAYPPTPRLSPDGTHVVYPSGDDVWVENVERGTRARLTASRGVNDDDPVWTPDGSRVTFGSEQTGSSWDLVWKPADGSGEAEVLLNREHPQFPSSWSPDGQILAFYEVHPETQRDIWLLPLGDRAPSPLLVTDANEHSAMFSPDGRFIAYVSDESGREEVYVRSYAGPPGRWLISSEGGRAPVWSRDGRELFYRHGSRLMTVAVTLEPTFTAGQPQQLFVGSYELYMGGSNSYDAAPDGQRFVMVQGESASTSYPLRIVVNWLEELNRLVPTEH